MEGKPANFQQVVARWRKLQNYNNIYILAACCGVVYIYIQGVYN